MLPWRKSIRGRLLAWLALPLLLVLGTLAATWFQLLRQRQLQEIDEALRARVAALAEDVRRMSAADRTIALAAERRQSPLTSAGTDAAPRVQIPRSRAATLDTEGRLSFSSRVTSWFDENDDQGYYFAVWLDGGVTRRSSNASAGLLRPRLPVNEGPLFTRLRDTGREMYFINERGDCMLTGISLEPYRMGLRRVALGLSVAVLAVFAAALWGIGWLVRRALAPVETIANTVGHIAEGNLAERIHVSRTDDELGRLAGVLNGAFSRLEGAFARQKSFTADAACELRTPLTQIIAEAHATLAKSPTADEYRESLGRCLRTADQMRRLTDGLLELSRFDAGSETLRREEFDLADLVQEAVDNLRTLAKERRVTFECDLDSTPMLGDSLRLTQVAASLLGNAVEYNLPGGHIRVRTRLTLMVANTGPGIPEPDLPRIFDRFFRCGRTRTGADRPSGLGLTLCRTIVEAHGGRIEVASAPNAFTVFTVRLPNGKSLRRPIPPARVKDSAVAEPTTVEA